MRSGRGAVATVAALAMITGLAAAAEGATRARARRRIAPPCAARSWKWSGPQKPTTPPRCATRCWRARSCSGWPASVCPARPRNGDRALAQVSGGAKNQKASNDVVELVRERGAWRVASLGGPQPPAPKKPGDES